MDKNKTGGTTGSNQYGPRGTAKTPQRQSGPPVMSMEGVTALITPPRPPVEHIPPAARPVLKISPSDFAFLRKSCPRCYYMKVVHGKKRPAGSFPSVFNAIDLAMRGHYTGKRVESALPGLPSGTIQDGKFVKAKPVILDGAIQPIRLQGTPDAVVEFDDGTCGIIDYKCIKPKPDLAERYSPQTHSYAYALENPDPYTGREPRIVSRMGLLCWSPESYDGTSLQGKPEFIEIEHDREWFRNYLTEVAQEVSRPEPPPPSPSCEWCAYLAEAGRAQHQH